MAALAAVIEYLTREKYRSLLIEAGAGVNGSAFEAGIVDKIFFYYAPKIIGGLIRYRQSAAPYARATSQSASRRSRSTKSRRMNSRWKVMFTGIIEETGRVLATPPRLRIACERVLTDTAKAPASP